MKKNHERQNSATPKLMVATMFGGIALCVIFAMLYHFFNAGWMESCAIAFGTIAYHMLIRFLSPVILIAIFHRRYNYNNRWFCPKKWEPSLYRILKVRKWKKLTGRLTYDPSEFSSEIHTYEEIINNMCHAEAVHELIVLLSFTSLLFAIPFGAFPVFLITAVVAALMDSVFVIMQRYNRPRLVRYVEKTLSKK